jgi:hypothetical protein
VHVCQRCPSDLPLCSLCHVPLLWLAAPQVTGSLLDDDEHYAQCEPLLLASANGSSWEFKGVRAALRWGGGGMRNCAECRGVALHAVYVYRLFWVAVLLECFVLGCCAHRAPAS